MNKASSDVRIGFIGFGSVAGVFSTRIVERGFPVYSYDRNLLRAEGLSTLKARRGGAVVQFLPLERVTAACDLLLSTVPPGQALAVAREASMYLCSDKLFIDLSSVSPEKKLAMAAIVDDTGASFVDGVILDSVDTAGADAEILLSGPEGNLARDLLARYGLVSRVVGSKIGQAASLKMLRSICSKGFEVLLLEAMLAARSFDLDEELWRILQGLFEKSDFPTMARAWIVSHPQAAQRRSEEMSDVVDTIMGIGFNPLVTRSVLAFFERSATLGLERIPRMQLDESAKVIDALYARMKDGTEE